MCFFKYIVLCNPFNTVYWWQNSTWWLYKLHVGIHKDSNHQYQPRLFFVFFKITTPIIYNFTVFGSIPVMKAAIHLVIFTPRTELPVFISPSRLLAIQVFQYLVWWVLQEACGPLLLNAGLYPASLSHIQYLFWSNPPTTSQSLNASNVKHKTQNVVQENAGLCFRQLSLCLL